MSKREINVDLIYEKIDNIQKTVAKIEDKLENDYVTQDQHQVIIDKVSLLQKIVFGFVWLILVSVVWAFMTLIMK